MVRKKYFVLAVCSLFVMTGCSGGLHTEMESAVIMEAESECTDIEKSDKELETYEEADIATESVSDSSEDTGQNVEDTGILAAIIGAMGQQGSLAIVPAMMQMSGMNMMPAQPVVPPEPAKMEEKEVEKLPENNLAMSDKPLDEGAAASLAAMFRDDDD